MESFTDSWIWGFVLKVMPHREARNTHTHTHHQGNHRTPSLLSKHLYAHVLNKSWGTASPPKKTHTHTHAIHRLNIAHLDWEEWEKGVSSPAIVSCRAGERMPRWKADAKQFNKKSDLNAPFIEPTMGGPTIGLRFTPWRWLFLMPRKIRKKEKKLKLTRFDL